MRVQRVGEASEVEEDKEQWKDETDGRPKSAHRLEPCRISADLLGKQVGMRKRGCKKVEDAVRISKDVLELENGKEAWPKRKWKEPGALFFSTKNKATPIERRPTIVLSPASPSSFHSSI